MWSVARLELMSGNHFLPVTYLEFEKMERPLQNQKRAVVERQQRRLNAVMADQNKPGEQQLLWESQWCWQGVMRRLERRAGRENALKICQKRWR